MWFTYEQDGEHGQATVVSLDDVLAELREVGYAGPAVEVFSDTGQTVCFVVPAHGVYRVRFP